MSKEELIALGKKIVTCQGTEKEIDEMIEVFNRNVPHPDGANLFYWPEKHDFRVGGVSAYNPTVEEVVDKCLAYKPVILGYKPSNG